MVLDTIRVYFTYTSMDWIGLDFGSARIVSSYELGEKIGKFGWSVEKKR